MMRYETYNVNMKTTCKRRDHGFYMSNKHTVLQALYETL